MLAFAFFVAVFSSVSWLIYAGLYIDSKFSSLTLWELPSSELLSLMAIVLVPILTIWVIFGFINQYINNKGILLKQSELLHQLQKNQDYTDLVVRVMLDAEHEIKDGFVLNKFDMFVADMNEALAEIIYRCNIASSAQLEQLWLKVRRGEKWTMGKAILDASKSQSTFNAWVREKVDRDKVFRGSLLEFCSRYQNLLNLLEKHDRDRLFLHIIESGVFGKVYSIIAPLSDAIERKEIYSDRVENIKDNRDYASVLKVANIEEPEASDTIINVDENDEEDFIAPKKSFFSKLNPFSKKEDEEDFAEQDPFFQALHNSFKDDNVSSEPSLSNNENISDLDDVNVSEVRIDEKMSDEFPVTSVSSFSGVKEILNNIRKTSEQNFENNSEKIVEIEEIDDEKADDDDDDLAYPFGGWTNEDNYRK